MRILLSGVCVLALNAPLIYAQDATARAGEITAIRGDLYQVRDRDQVAVFLVTPEGIILVDPLNPELARWLKGELETRFPGRPVRYVLYSSHRVERAAGASVYDTDEIVAHDNFQAAWSRASASLPLSLASFDQNRNLVLERSESAALGPEVLARDRDRDGEVSAAEVWGDVSLPARTYRGRHVIELGGRRVELIHPGDGLGIDATVFLFTGERVLFAPGVPLQEVPASFAQTSPAAFVEALRELERVEFDTLVSERGETRTVADLGMDLGVVREYVDAMLEGVKARFKKGDTIEQIQASLVLERFNGLRNFDVRRARHIAEAYGQLRLVRLDVSGAAEFVYLQRDEPPCAPYERSTEATCTGVGGPTFAGAGGLTVMIGRAGGALEISRSGVVTGTDETPAANVASFQSRDTVTAFLFRYDALPTGRIGLVVTTGIARIAMAQRAEFRGFGSLEINRSTKGTVFGADLAAGMGRLRFIVPVRVMRASEIAYNPLTGDYDPQWSIRVGIGVSVPLMRAVW